MTEQGSVNAAISAPDPATGLQNISEKWQYSSVTLEKGIAPNSGFSSWLEQIQSSSIGNAAETIPPPSSADVPPSPVTASFGQQDQVSACFMPVVPIGHPPNPCITIDATANTWGSVTINVLHPPQPIFPEVDAGTTQYTDSLTETILMPDGSMQSLSQTSMDMGSFVSIQELNAFRAEAGALLSTVPVSDAS
jgi:hypothetical protein